MKILGDISVDEFLSHYWQQKPLLISGASANYSDVLSADELAGLACEDSVESRLIVKKSSDQWLLQDGPIPEEQFSDLPEQDWTLLVQGVDLWVPEVRAVIDEFSFLPNWRLDDVMVSYATPGGGVGPHFDYYDVFLLQTNGRRRWKLGQRCNQSTKLKEGQPLKLLENFETTAEFELGPGDILYVPAGVAHWGTGVDDQCMTWSIGFRAPSAKELLAGAVELLAQQLPEDIRYQDSLDSLKSQKGEINSSAVEQLLQLFRGVSEQQFVGAMSDVLGEMATEPRYPELFDSDLLDTEPWHIAEIQNLFEHNAILTINDAARMAFRILPENDSISRLYINGDSLIAPTELAEAICAGVKQICNFLSRNKRESYC